jgi:AMIN domain-containing protein
VNTAFAFGLGGWPMKRIVLRLVALLLPLVLPGGGMAQGAASQNEAVKAKKEDPASGQVIPTTSVATIIARVDIGRTGQQTIVRVEGNGRLTCEPQSLNDPERLVLDFSGARLAARRTSMPSALKPVRGVRLGQFKPNVTRVVIDLEHVAPYSVKSEGNILTVAFAGSTAAPASSPVAAQEPTAQEKYTVDAYRIETAQQVPVPQATTSTPAMPQPQSSEQRTAAPASPVMAEVKTEFGHLISDVRGGKLTLCAQNQTLPSILEEFGAKANVAFIASEGLEDKQLSVDFQHYQQAPDQPRFQGLTLRYCTIQPSRVASEPTLVFTSSGELYLPQYKDKWMLRVSAAHGRNKDGSPKVDWRMTYGYYDARKKALDECEKWLSRIDKAIEGLEKEASK